MEKEMLAIVKFKETEGSFEKFMGFMQSEEGLNERKKFAHPEKTIASVTPDKSAVMFKVFVYDEAGMINFVSGKNEIVKPIYDECIEVSMLYDCTTVNMQQYAIQQRKQNTQKSGFQNEITIFVIRLIRKNL